MPPLNSNIKTFTVIIQARIGSTRLPGKAMLSLKGKPLIAHVIERAKAIKGVATVVLATGNAVVNKPLIDLAHAMQIDAFSGSDDNVLDRFYRAHEQFGGDYVIRATGEGTADNIATAQGRLMAARAAELDAKRKLAEQINGLHIDSQTTVQDFITQHDRIATQMSSALLGSYVESTEFTGETARVTVAIPATAIWSIVNKESRIRMQ